MENPVAKFEDKIVQKILDQEKIQDSMYVTVLPAHFSLWFKHLLKISRFGLARGLELDNLTNDISTIQRSTLNLKYSPSEVKLMKNLLQNWNEQKLLSPIDEKVFVESINLSGKSIGNIYHLPLNLLDLGRIQINMPVDTIDQYDDLLDELFSEYQGMLSIQVFKLDWARFTNTFNYEYDENFPIELRIGIKGKGSAILSWLYSPPDNPTRAKLTYKYANYPEEEIYFQKNKGKGTVFLLTLAFINAQKTRSSSYIYAASVADKLEDLKINYKKSELNIDIRRIGKYLHERIDKDIDNTIHKKQLKKIFPLPSDSFRLKKSIS